MAEGATAAPAGGPRAKGGSSMPFWKSWTGKRKPQEAPRPPAEPPSGAPPPAPPSPSDSRDSQQPSSGSRRNLKVSRSGRFKEKRRCRSALPTDDPQALFEGGCASPAARPGEEAPCQ